METGAELEDHSRGCWDTGSVDWNQKSGPVLFLHMNICYSGVSSRGPD